MEILWEALAQGGPVAVLALIIFIMYRRDSTNSAARWQEMLDDHIKCRNDENASRKELTVALTRLGVLIERSMNNKSPGS